MGSSSHHVECHAFCRDVLPINRTAPVDLRLTNLEVCPTIGRHWEVLGFQGFESPAWVGTAATEDGMPESEVPKNDFNIFQHISCYMFPHFVVYLLYIYYRISTIMFPFYFAHLCSLTWHNSWRPAPGGDPRTDLNRSGGVLNVMCPVSTWRWWLRKTPNLVGSLLDHCWWSYFFWPWLHPIGAEPIVALRQMFYFFSHHFELLKAAYLLAQDVQQMLGS